MTPPLRHPMTAGSSGAGTADEAEQRLAGTVVRMTFQNKENGFCVLKLRPDTAVERRWTSAPNEVAVVGVMPGVEVGQTVECGGTWELDAKLGPRFRATWYKPSLPKGRRGMEAYLASGAVPGVGPKTAERIVAQFGDRTFDVLDETPARLAEVPGLGRKNLQRIADGWRRARGDRELVAFLGEHGISPGLAPRLSKVYGGNALAIVRANPYRLTGEVRGIGFLRADEIARQIGIAPDAPERIDAALVHVLQRQSEEGHTCLSRMRLEALAAELVEAPAERVSERLAEGAEQGKIVLREVAGVESAFIPALHDDEVRLAHRLRELARAKRRLPQLDPVAALADFEQRAQFNLAPEQRRAALELAREGLLILTGGPGTGKTTTVRAILELFRDGRRSVRLAAPTGRAARRLGETAKLQAETVHRLLNFQPHLGRFSRNAGNPIEADLVIVDEVSMLDVPLAAALMDALAPGTCLLLVGDEDQLPSVGPGNVLGDVIAAEIYPVVRLTEIFRQAGESLIVTNAHRINRGLMPYLEPPEGGKAPDFFFIERDEPAEVVEAIRTLACERIPKKFGFDPLKDVQILTPMRRGELGVEALNRALKAQLNPSGGEEEREAAVAGAGDRVMQVANNYEKGVFNGDIGRVERVDAESGEVLVDYDGRAVAYLADETDQLQLAYATTIHKSQGSEFPAVIIPIHTTHWIMLQRNLIYTALTRARRLACLVGTRRALRRAVGNMTRQTRSTALRAFLAERDEGEG